MKIENNQLYDFIKDSGLIESDGLELANKEAQESSERLGDILLKKKLIDEIKLREWYAYIAGVPFVDLTKEIIPVEILQIVPEPIAKKYKIVAFGKIGQDLMVAMLNPEDIQTVDFIRKKTGSKIIICLTTEDSINVVLKQYEKSLKAEFGDIIEKNSAEVAGEEEDLERSRKDCR